MDDRAATNRATYDAIAPAYLARQHGRGMSPFVQRAFEQLPTSGRVLDLGCGPGHQLPLLAARGLEPVGLDLSPGMLALGSGPRVRADVRVLPFTGSSFEAVWSSYALLHVDDSGLLAALREIARVLRPGGVLAMIVSSGDGAELEPVDYSEGLARWYHLRQPDRVLELAAVAGLEVLSSAHEPGGWRAPFALVAAP